MYKKRLDMCKISYEKIISGNDIGICTKYILAKKVFEPCQRWYDMLWSNDPIFDCFGGFVGVRLNSNFFKLSKVKRQLNAAKGNRDE